MQTTTYSCDRCGRPAVERTRLYRNQIDEGGCHAYSFDMIQQDLCAECVAELTRWIAEFKDKETT